MELRSTREMRRNEQLSKTMAKKAETADTSTAQAVPRRQEGERADQVSISRQALDYIEEMNRKMWQSAQEREERRHSWLDSQLDALETQEKQLDEMNKKLDVLNKCQKIAASIMKGDNVPPEDMAYLMQHDQEGFKMAIAMRRPKKDPEDVKSVLDDEDKNGGSAEGDGGGEAPAVSAPEASSGGGAAGGSTDAE